MVNAEHNCGPESLKWMYFDGTARCWRFDLDDGMTGPSISHCPFCGEKFEEENVVVL